MILSIAATFLTFVLPTLAVFGILVFGQPNPRPFLAALVSILVTAVAVAAGAAVWHAQPESEGHSFGDLMLWSWFRRRNAEHRLRDGAMVVGLHRDGSFRDAGTMSIADRRRALGAIAAGLDAKSSYTVGHSTRVQEHAVDIADELEMASDEIEALEVAAMLHNIGNLAIPETVLRRTGELTDEERALVEQHVDLGSSLVMAAGLEKPIADAIQHHHERWDGTGYPDGLAGEDIPLFARIIAVAESFDAMTSTRPYRSGLSRAEAITELRAGAGTQFDEMVVEALVATLPSERGILAAAALPAIAQRRIQQTGVAFRRVGRVAFSATASTIAIALVLGATVLDSGVPRPIEDVRPDRDRLTDQVLGTRITDGDSAQASGALPGAGIDTDDLPEETDEDSDTTTLTGSVGSDPILIGSTGVTEDDGSTDPYPGEGDGATDPGEPEPQPTTEPSPEPSTEPQPEPTPSDDGPGNGHGNAHGHDKNKPKDEPTP